MYKSIIIHHHEGRQEHQPQPVTTIAAHQYNTINNYNELRGRSANIRPYDRGVAAYHHHGGIIKHIPPPRWHTSNTYHLHPDPNR